MQTTPAPSATGLSHDAAVRARSLTKIYGSGASQVVALDHVDVDFTGGQFTAIMGPSGSGKSTLMHLLAGLDSASAGQAFLGDTEITSLNDDGLTNLRRTRLGFVFQSFNLLPTLTAEQNILLPLELAGRRVDRAVFNELTTSLGLTDRLRHRPSQLSGGQQQRVAVARAMMSDPEVVFADEPTGALDQRTGTALLEYLQRRSRQHGQTIIMVTHDPKAAAYADRVLMLLDGRIVNDVDDPTADEVFALLNAVAL